MKKIMKDGTFLFKAREFSDLTNHTKVILRDKLDMSYEDIRINEYLFDKTGDILPITYHMKDNKHIRTTLDIFGKNIEIQLENCDADENDMEHKNKLINIISNIKDELDNLYDLYSNEMDEYDRLFIKQIMEENNLGNLNELTSIFNSLEKGVKKADIIDGYKVWINDYDALNVIVNNEHIIIEREFGFALSKNKLVKHIEENIANKILSWYIKKI